MMARKKFKENVDPYKMGKMNEALDDEYKKKIFVAYKDKIPVASIVGSAIGNTGIYLLGASNEIGMKNKASYLLQWEMIKWLKQKGCQRYDLGGINKDENPGDIILNLELLIRKYWVWALLNHIITGYPSELLVSESLLKDKLVPL